ncbi:MAG: hypothetical protein L0H70_06360 [Xanthomonadales bacterium]|nr:hypothetical protein [Xanthomonadales bacterium]
MNRLRLLLAMASVASFITLVPALAQGKPVTNIGDALFGCARASDYTSLAGYALTGEMQKFGRGLLSKVAAGECTLFKTDEAIELTGKQGPTGITQIRPVAGKATWWTDNEALHGVKPPLPEGYGKVSSKLYLGKGANQPLLVGLGGAEGGNAWAGEHHAKQRASILKHGYAFLALAYFQRRPGAPVSIPSASGIPASLDRVSLNGVHQAIVKAAKHANINASCIAVVGGSRGAELALLLASHFKDIKAVVALAPSDVAYMGTDTLTTSAWMFNDKPVAHIRFDGRALPALLQGDIKQAMQTSRADDPAAKAALIGVQNIHGPVAFMSGVKDHMWDSTSMSQHMMQTLAQADFPYAFQHLTLGGGHTAPAQHMDYALTFLDRYFKTDSATGCARTR